MNDTDLISHADPTKPAPEDHPPMDDWLTEDMDEFNERQDFAAAWFGR